MKKITIFFTLLLCSFLSFAQSEKGAEEQSKSKALEFLAKDGSFKLKEFYDLGSVKGVKCEVLIITDVVDNIKVGCLRVETSHYVSYSYGSDTYIGTLDYDELDACIKSIKYIQETLLPSTPEVYTESEYRTRDNVKVGAYFDKDKSKWTAFMYTKGYTSKSAAFFDSSSLTELCDLMQKAKEMIAEKVKK